MGRDSNGEGLLKLVRLRSLISTQLSSVWIIIVQVGKVRNPAQADDRFRNPRRVSGDDAFCGFP